MESKYICEPCKLSTNYKNVYDKHITSKKHIDRTNNTPQQSIEKFVCDKCNKSYTTNCGLWKHRKKCMDTNTPAENISIVQTSSCEEQIESPDNILHNNDENNHANTIRPKTQFNSEEEEKEFILESLDIQRARITVHIIQTILQHMDVTRDELNSIIDEVYLEREIAKQAEEESNSAK